MTVTVVFNSGKIKTYFGVTRISWETAHSYRLEFPGASDLVCTGVRFIQMTNVVD